jgi:hypothetical protein
MLMGRHPSLICVHPLISAFICVPVFPSALIKEMPEP